jgi:T5orf172 domain
MTDEAIAVLDEYQLKGLPITPAGIKGLILELFNGQTVERNVIVKAVNELHLRRGGEPARAADFPRSVKKALSELKETGIATNPSFGFWRISDSQIPKILPEMMEVSHEESAPRIEAEITIGAGDSTVYVYYYRAYRLIAERDGKSTWPCKIGRSDRDPVSRIYSQASTALPEAPTIGLLLCTPLPSQWESVLHDILAIRGRIVEEAPGEEWFDTSPNELVEIIRYIDPSIAH